MLKLVLDTNILVSSLLSLGPPASIIDRIVEGSVIPYYSDLILQEYWDVLSRKKFSFNSLQVTRLINDIVRSGLAVDYTEPTKIKMHDESDRIFYEAAFYAQAYLITGNKRNFPKESFIVSPVEFLSILLGQSLM